MKRSPFWHKLLPGGEPVQFSNSEYANLTRCPDGKDFTDSHSDIILVIGCGLTGASCALRLMELGASSVVVVDERGIGDGATGRNGGHQWPEIRRDCSKEESKIAELCSDIEMFDIQTVRTFIKSLPESEQEAISLHITGGVEITYREEDVPFFHDFVHEVGSRGVDAEGVEVLLKDKLESEEHIHSQDAKAGIRMPQPAQFVPAQLTLSLVKKAQSLGANFLTGIKVESIERSEQYPSKWRICLTNDRFQCNHINVSKVVHATNGYGHTLLPERLRSCMSTYRGQCISAIVPPEIKLNKSIILECCDGSHEEYLIRRVKDDIIIFGGCRHVAENEAVDSTDDEVVESIVTDELKKQLKRLLPFPSNSELAERRQDFEYEVTHEWSGIMCRTRDGQPVVGELRECPGQFIAAGYNGHGMVRAFSCGIHIAEMVLGKDFTCAKISEAFNVNRY